MACIRHPCTVISHLYSNLLKYAISSVAFGYLTYYTALTLAAKPKYNNLVHALAKWLLLWLAMTSSTVVLQLIFTNSIISKVIYYALLLGIAYPSQTLRTFCSKYLIKDEKAAVKHLTLPQGNYKSAQKQSFSLAQQVVVWLVESMLTYSNFLVKFVDPQARTSAQQLTRELAETLACKKYFWAMTGEKAAPQSPRMISITQLQPNMTEQEIPGSRESRVMMGVGLSSINVNLTQDPLLTQNQIKTAPVQDPVMQQNQEPSILPVTQPSKPVPQQSQSTNNISLPLIEAGKPKYSVENRMSQSYMAPSSVMKTSFVRFSEASQYPGFMSCSEVIQLTKNKFQTFRPLNIRFKPASNQVEIMYNDGRVEYAGLTQVQVHTALVVELVLISKKRKFVEFRNADDFDIFMAPILRRGTR